MLRHEHRAGEKLFVDFGGDTVPVHDPATGAVHDAAIFVAVLGASSYTYAATWRQGLADWIGAHVRAFEVIGGAAEILVPDNLKSGVNRACRYKPDLNRAYEEMAAHYGVAVIPARRPKAARQSFEVILHLAKHMLVMLPVRLGTHPYERISQIDLLCADGHRSAGDAVRSQGEDAGGRQKPGLLQHSDH